MNLRLVNFLLCIFLFPTLSLAGPDIVLQKSDFVKAESVAQNERAVVRLTLSASGKNKLSEPHKANRPKDVQVNVAGIAANFHVKASITSDHIEVGPYSVQEAQKVVAAINRR
ncbi:MAG: hypothetical protein H6623_08545 [Bdellovibrionaceae bacterium]|nr:hypothetical protein [Pseudobdellovibrionaceae bacterium]